MAISFPAAADTTDWTYRASAQAANGYTLGGATTGAQYLNQSSVGNLEVGDHILVFLTKDDDVETITIPTGLSYIEDLDGVSGTYSQIAEFKDTGGDDATVAVYVCKITGDPTTAANHNWTFSASEESMLSAVLVKGAHDDFDYSKAATTVSDQNTNAPDPGLISDVSNWDAGTVVVVVTGNRSDAGHLNDNDISFDTSPPSGYTIISGNPATSGQSNDQGGPGRLEFGTGNGDAQMTWAYKELATATNSENPGAFAGFVNARDHKVITFLIRPAATGTAHTDSETEAVGATDSTTAAKAATQAPTEAVGATDTVARVHPAQRSKNEAVGVDDTVSSAKQVVVTITEAVGVGDDTSRLRTATRSVVETVGVSDAVSDNENNRDTRAEPVGVGDVVSRIHSAVRSETEAVGVSDAAIPAKTIQAVVTEAVGSVDGVSEVLSGGATEQVTEAVGATDSVSVGKTIQVTISEAVGATDTTADVTSRIPGSFALSDFAALYDGRSLPASGDITTWDDETTNARDLAGDASPGTNLPSVSTTQFGGEKAAYFDDANSETLEYDEGSEFYSLDIGTITVFRFDTFVAASDVIFSAATGGSGSTWKHILGTIGTGSAFVLMSGDGSGEAHKTFGEPQTAKDFIVVEYIRNTGDDDAWVNGAQKLDGENSGGNNLRGWRLGSRETDDRYFNGWIAYHAIIEMDGFTEADLLAAAEDVAGWYGVPWADGSELSNEAVGVTDDVSAVKTSSQTITDAVGVTDDTAAAKTIQVEIDESVGATDDTSRVSPIIRAITEPVGVVDPVSEGENNRETAVDSVGATDSTSRVVDAVRSQNSPADVTDVVERAWTIKRTVTEAVGATDTTDPTLAITQSIDEAVGGSDVVGTAFELARSIDETVGVTDDTPRVHDAVRSVDEAVEVTDSVDDILTGSGQEVVVEPVGVSDATSRVHDAVRSSADDAGVTDDVSVAKASIREATEAAGVTDLVSEALDRARTATDATSVTDSTAVSRIIRRTIDESVGGTDSVAEDLSGGLSEVRNEPVGATDPVSRVHNAIRARTEPVGASDEIQPAKTSDRAVTDAAAVADAVMATKVIAINITESVGAADPAAHVSGFYRVVIEPVGVTEELVRVGGRTTGPPPDAGQRSFATTDRTHSDIVTGRTFLEIDREVN